MLTTLLAVKARLKIREDDVLDDVLLSQFIASVSERFAGACNRPFGYSRSVTDEFDGNETELRLRYFPIDESQPITFTLLEKASAGWQAITVDYIVRKGCVLSLSCEAGTGKMQLRVTYSGGYLLPDVSQTAWSPAPPSLPDDLQGAAIEQVAYLYQNKDRLGVTGMTGQHGGFQQMSKLNLLPQVEDTLKRYERYMN